MIHERVGGKSLGKERVQETQDHVSHVVFPVGSTMNYHTQLCTRLYERLEMHNTYNIETTMNDTVNFLRDHRLGAGSDFCELLNSLTTIPQLTS